MMNTDGPEGTQTPCYFRLNIFHSYRLSLLGGRSHLQWSRTDPGVAVHTLGLTDCLRTRQSPGHTQCYLELAHDTLSNAPSPISPGLPVLRLV